MLGLLIISLIAFLGFPVGFWIMRLAPEERKSGKPYYPLFAHALFFGSVALGLWLGWREPLTLLIIVVFLLVFVFKYRWQHHLITAFYSVMLGASWNGPAFLTFAGLAFLWTMFSGLYLADPKCHWTIVLPYSYLVVLPWLLTQVF